MVILCFPEYLNRFLFSENINMAENHTINLIENITTKDNLEDFEEFDLRDAINVGAYSVMSASKVLFSLFNYVD